MTCLDKLIKSRGSMQDTSKRSKGVNMNHLSKLLALKISIMFFYHPSCPIATFREVVFSLREKIDKNQTNDRVINLKRKH